MIIKFREVNDLVSVTARMDTINRGAEKERNRDRERRAGRGLINEKGVTWRCAAHQPRFAPFHLRFHPLLRPSFGFSFLRPSFFSLCFVIPMLYLLCQRNPTPLPLLFLSSRAVQPRLADISISTFVALLNFTLLHFYAITFRDVAPL